MVDVNFGAGPCLFCGQLIDEVGVDPCSVTVETSTGAWQVWSCHAECFRAKIVDNEYVDLSPGIF